MFLFYYKTLQPLRDIAALEIPTIYLLLNALFYILINAVVYTTIRISNAVIFGLPVAFLTTQRSRSLAEAHW